MTIETGGVDTPKTVEELQAELEKVQAALKKANGEAAERRKKLEAIESDGTETEKLQKLLAEERTAREKTEGDLKSFKIRMAVLAKAAELQFEHPEDALALTDISSVEIAEDKVTGFEKSLEALAKSKRLPMKTETAKGTPRQPGQQAKVQTEPESIKIRL